MLLLISDTNVLIDIETGNLTPSIFRLPYKIAVLDVLFDSELAEQHSHLLQAGLKIKSLTAEFVKRAETLTDKYPQPSTMDRLALALALQEKCPLLTGDKGLRLAAKSEGVEVHGTLWVVEALLNANIIEPEEARTSFDSMKARGRRLPWGKVDELFHSRNLVGAKNE